MSISRRCVFGSISGLVGPKIGLSTKNMNFDVRSELFRSSCDVRSDFDWDVPRVVNWLVGAEMGLMGLKWTCRPNKEIFGVRPVWNDRI